MPAPHATATFVSSFEFVCGILLALGLLSRIAAFGLVIDMFTAYWTAEVISAVRFISNPDKFQNAASFIYLFVGLLILIFGAGKISWITCWIAPCARRYAATVVRPWLNPCRVAHWDMDRGSVQRARRNSRVAGCFGATILAALIIWLGAATAFPADEMISTMVIGNSR